MTMGAVFGFISGAPARICSGAMPSLTFGFWAMNGLLGFAVSLSVPPPDWDAWAIKSASSGVWLLLCCTKITSNEGMGGLLGLLSLSKATPSNTMACNAPAKKRVTLSLSEVGCS